MVLAGLHQARLATRVMVKKSARGLAHSKTLARRSKTLTISLSFGVRQPSGALGPSRNYSCQTSTNIQDDCQLDAPVCSRQEAKGSAARNRSLIPLALM